MRRRCRDRVQVSRIMLLSVLEIVWKHMIEVEGLEDSKGECLREDRNDT